MENPIIQIIWNNTKWLYTGIFEIGIFYVDLWSFVHLWSGAVVFAMLTAFKFRKRWLKLFICLAVYEAIENPILIAIMNVFKPEKIVDVLNDLWTGMLGGLLVYLYFKWNNSNKDARFAAMFLSSITIAFLWAGWYGDNYSNAAYLDWSQMGIMLLFGLSIISLYRYFVKIISVAAASFVPIVGIEVHIFYFFAPFFFIALYLTFLQLFEKYQAEEIKLIANG